MKELLEELVNWLVKFSGKLFVAILIIVIGLKLVKFLMKRIKNSRSFKKLEKSSQTFIASILNIFIKIPGET